ncbi:hypothetical protein CRV24_005163 [Beauveria bassiana]|nr:hypothetical protein CRV24_005163 [Beauveria bassiana]KAH8709903.1 hypothetical protein HC256_009811 [Beauveria bassiana]
MCKSFPALQRLSFGAKYSSSDSAKCSPSQLSTAGTRRICHWLTELVVAAPFLHRDENDDDCAFWASLLAPNLNVLRFEAINGDWLALPLISAVGDNCSQMRSVTVDCKQPPADEAAVRSMLDSKSIGHEFCYTVAAEPADSDHFSRYGIDESGDSDDNEESEESDGSDDIEESEESDD